MTNPPVCLKLYKSELEDIQREIFKLRRLKTASQLLALPFIGLGSLSFFFPKLFGESINIDSVYKLYSMIFGAVFFASISFFNKGDFLNLRKRKGDLEIFIIEYDNYEMKNDSDKVKIYEECEKVIQKRKGL